MRREFLRFLIGGGVNTLLTYGLFIAAATQLKQAAAYTFAYVTGIVLSYFINAYFVFKRTVGIRSTVLYPTIYIIQYVLGLVILTFATGNLGLSKEAAMILVIAANVPVTFLLSRWILGLKAQR